MQQPFEIDRDGLTIRGMTYRPSAPGRLATVVFLHGFTGQRIETGFLFVQLARALNRLGMAAVTFDFLHSGESDGSFEHMLPSGELADALRVTDWVQGQSFVDRSRLALLGFSLGGLLASCTAARSSAYKALVLLAPTTPDNISRIARESLVDGKRVRGALVLNERFFDDVATLDPMIDLIRKPRATLLVQGTGDMAVPPSVSDHYVQAMQRVKAPLTHELIGGADHGFSMPAYRQQLAQIVGDWLTRELA